MEQFLRLQPGILHARAVGVAAGERARLVAFVTLRPGAAFDEAAALEACRDQIAPFKVPARIMALDAFPVSEGANARKIPLDVLREMAVGALRPQ